VDDPPDNTDVLDRTWVPLITCEHGGNRVPVHYGALFARRRRVLTTHRAYDRGALELARRFAARLEAPRVTATTTRLLIDLNRSPGHPHLFSEITAALESAARRAIFRRYWTAYRRRVQSLIDPIVTGEGRVLHLSVHTFTPVLDGSPRRVDVGLLYDPSRPLERRFCQAWQKTLRLRRSDLRIRRNYPYRGTSDGLTSWLRDRHEPERYAGIELEVNQRWHRDGGSRWRRLQRDLVETFAACWQGGATSGWPGHLQ